MAPTKIYMMMALGMALQLVQGGQPPVNNLAVCTTPQCVLTAASIMRDMKAQVDPCEDFNAFTCGGFIEREEIPADQESIGYFRLLREENNRVIRSIVESNTTKALDDEVSQRNMQKLKDLYNSCMDEDQIAKAGRQPVVDQVNQLLTLFPVSDSENATGIDRTALSMTLAHLTNIGVDSFNSFDVSTDFKDPKRHVLSLSEGGLGLPSKEYYLDDKIMDVYEKKVGEMFNLIMGEDLPAKWAQVAKSIIDFEKDLAAAATDVNDLRNSEKSNNPRSLEEIAALTPSIDFTMILKNTLPENADIPLPIIVTSLPFQQHLETLLQRTSQKTLQHYLTWSVIRQLAGYLSKPYVQPLRDMNAVLTGVSATAIPERWKQCVAIVNRQLGEIAGQYFVQETFKGDSRTQVHNMIESLRETYIDVFPELDWLDESAVEGAVKKMKAIVQLIGFSTDSPNVASAESLEKYYEDYKVDAKDFFGNQMRAELWGTSKSFQELAEPVNMLKMHMVPQTVNAYYSPTQNQVVFPAGILQSPFFHAENPEYINYGGIGVVAGHEITHGFDNRGHLFDSEGRMVNWWSATTTTAFNEKARCFVEQYGNFTVKGNDGEDYHVNGQLTLGENIADNGGLKQSFSSWQARYKSDRSGKEYKNYKLPGLDKLTPEQLFFVSYARPWCSKQRPESAIRQMRTDPHSPAKWRINGAVQNSVAFARAFNCPVGAPMNPEKKCNLW